MKASELSLGHKCYRVTVDTIEDVWIDGIISSNEKGKMVICFKGDYKHYLVNMSDKNVQKTYFFTRDDAEIRQNRLRVKALVSAAIKKARADKDYKLLMEKYQEIKESEK